MSLFYGLAIVTIFLLLLYRYLTSPYDYFEKQGVKTVPSPIPGFGHTFSILTLRESLADVSDRLYRSCSPDTSMLGLFLWRTPMLMVRDPELVKTVLVDKFSSFKDNLMQLDESRDWFLSKHPFLTTGVTWKENRTRLLYGMSTNKLKILFEPMRRVCEQFDRHLDQMLANNQTEVEIKQLCLGVTGDIVCNAGLGIDDKQRFTKIAAEIFESSWQQATRIVLNFYLPMIAAVSGFSFLSQKPRKYFADLTKRVLESRKIERKEKQDFFLDMMLYGEVNEEKAAGLMSSFVIDGFESVANLICFTLYKLSQQPDTQKKLQKEIHEILPKYGGKITFDALKDMTYLQQVCSESIRLHMTLPIGVKICNETTTFRGSDGQTCTVRPGDLVLVPIQSLHTDEKFFPDPFTFDASRFDPDKKKNITKYAYLPYGEGPRMCPGFKFGLLEMKTILVTILNKCSLSESDKTPRPLELDPLTLFLTARGGLWMKLERA